MGWTGAWRVVVVVAVVGCFGACGAELGEPVASVGTVVEEVPPPVEGAPPRVVEAPARLDEAAAEVCHALATPQARAYDPEVALVGAFTDVAGQLASWDEQRLRERGIEPPWSDLRTVPEGEVLSICTYAGDFGPDLLAQGREVEKPDFDCGIWLVRRGEASNWRLCFAANNPPQDPRSVPMTPDTLLTPGVDYPLQD